MYYSSSGDKEKTGDAVVTGATNAVKNLSSTTQSKEKWEGTKVGERYQAFYQGGKPLDDLWTTTTDVFGKTLARKPNSKAETVYLTDWFESATNRRKKLVTRQTLFKGSYVYFIPKDEKGKVTGEPIKLVRVDYTLDIMPDGSFRPMYNTSDTFRYSSNKPAYFLYQEVAPAYETIIKNPRGFSEFAIAKAKERVDKNVDALASKFSGEDGYSNYRGKASQSSASGIKLYQTIREAKKYKVYGSSGNYQVTEWSGSTPLEKDTYVRGTPVVVVDDNKPIQLVKVANENYFLKRIDTNTISGFDGGYDNAYGDTKDPRYNYTPNVSSRFTGLDDIRSEMDKYGAEGFITGMGADGFYYAGGDKKSTYGVTDMKKAGTKSSSGSTSGGTKSSSGSTSGGTKSSASSTLLGLQKNLGRGARLYKDKVVVPFTLPDKTKGGAYFFDNGVVIFLGGRDKKFARLNMGSWSNGGNEIVLISNGRVLNSGSVWKNISNSTTNDEILGYKNYVNQKAKQKQVAKTTKSSDLSFNGNNSELELSNMDGLDESIANAMGFDMGYGANGSKNNFKVIAIKDAPKIVNDRGNWIRKGEFSKGEIKTVVSTDRITFYCPMRKENVTRKLYIFADGTASVPPRWSRYSNADGYNAYSEDVSDFAKSSAPNQACETKKTNDIRECDNNYTFNMSNPATAGTAYNTYKLCVNSALATYNKCMGKSNFDGDLDFDADYSNLTNESLLDGLTENTSMLEFMGGDEYVNNGFADTLKVAIAMGQGTGVIYYRAGVLAPNQVKRVKSIFSNVVFNQGVDYSKVSSPKKILRLIEFTDKTVGLLSQWKKVSDLQSTNFEGDYSNLTNQSLLDGLTENTSMLEFTGTGRVINKTNATSYIDKGNYYKIDETIKAGTVKNVSEVKEVRVVLADKRIAKMAMLIFDDKTAGNPSEWESYSSIDGDYYNTSGVVDPATAVLNKIGDSQVVDGAVVDSEFNKSGAKRQGKSIGQWLKSDTGRNILNVLAQVATNVLAGRDTDKDTKTDTKSGGIVRTTNTGGLEFNNPNLVDDNKPKGETKILGMSPLVFGIVTVGVVAIGAVVTVKLIKAKQGK